MTDSLTVIKNMNMYHQLSALLAVLAVIFLVISVVLWHKLKVRDAIRVLTGFGAGKAVARLKADAEKEGIHHTDKVSKVAPVITWSKLTGQTSVQNLAGQTPVRMQQSTTMDINMIKNLNVDLSINKNATLGIFTVEQDIVYTGLPTMISA